MKLSVKIFFALLAFWGIHRFCHEQTAGFQVTKITSHLPKTEEWKTPSLSPQDLRLLKAIFSQPFTFFGSGGQCYAFLSSDGRIVLKLYKMHHLRQYPLLQRLHLPGIFDRARTQFLLSQKQKLHRVFSSSQLAFSELKNESGLLYLNLNPSKELENLHVTLVDKIGAVLPITLKDIPFAVQYRADNPFKMLRSHLKHKDLVTAKIVIKQIYDCLTTRYEKGISDLDPALRRNIGLLKNRAIAIDIGSFFKKDTSLTAEEKKQELLSDTQRMHRWLHKRSPELTAYLDTLIADYPPNSL